MHLSWHILVEQTPYARQQAYGASLFKALEAEGEKVALIDGASPLSPPRSSEKVRALLSFDESGLRWHRQPSLEGWTRLPHVVVVTRNPFHPAFLTHLRQPLERTCIALPDPSLVRALEQEFHYHGIETGYRLLYLPPPAILPPLPTEAPKGVLFPATYEPEEKIFKETIGWIVERRRLFDDLLSLAESFPQLALWEVWERLERELPLSSPLIAQWSRHHLIPLVARLLASRRRHRLVRLCARAGLFLTLVGRGWDKCPETDSHEWLREQSYQDLLQLMANKRCTLALPSPLIATLDERIRAPLLRGHLAAAPTTPHLSAFASDHPGCILFDWDEVDALPDRLRKRVEEWKEETPYGSHPEWADWHGAIPTLRQLFRLL